MQLNTFIKRPILSAVISVLIVLVGILGALSLPIERYPDIAPPSVEVSTTFFGANAQTLINSVITPLEEAINGVEDMMYMNSTASNSGDVTITVVFNQGTNPDMAAVNVQNRVQKAMSLLPAEVKQYGVITEKKQNSILQIFSVHSPDDTYDFKFLTNYVSINIKPRILLINGIGKFNVLGSDYSIRIWMDPFAMAQHDLIPNDVLNALSAQNFEAAAGSIGENSSETYQYAMKYTGRLKTLKEFENVIIRSEKDGTILRLGQVARVELGTETYMFNSTTNGHPGVCCMVYQMAGSNATAVNNEISALLEEMKAEAPSGIDITTMMSTNDFLFAAIDQVLETLRDAILLVILIVLIFLKDFKSTLIPFISIMVSLIGTFAFMVIAGFSINLLTLFALVLVIGTVVDDSIVVVEAVHAKFEAGVKSPFKATCEATQEVAMPVLTSSLVFMAVFIPVSFMPGTSGVFYKQFGLTMAVAVGISALNALTLVPALCAMMLKPLKKIQEGEKGTFKQRYSRWFDGLFERFSKSYQNGLGKIIKFKTLVWTVALAGIAGFVIFMSIMPSGLVPDEDQGMLIVEVSALPGTSVNATSRIATEISEEIRNVPGVQDLCCINGYGFIAGANSAAASIIIKLKHWDERGGETSIRGIVANTQAITAKYPETNCMVFSLPMIPGYGTNSGIDMYVQDRKGGTIQELYDITKEFTGVLASRGVNAFMAFNMDYPQWEVSVDVAKCMRAGVSPKDVMSVIGSYYGGSYVNDVNLYAKVYKVMVMGEPDTRRDETSLSKTYLRTASGEMSPVSNYISIKRVYGPDSIKTFNKFTAINLSGITAMSTGEALTVITECAKQLPEGYTVDFAGMAREQNSQGSLGLILILCMFIIYLILAALYESVVIPFAVLLAVPLGLAGSFGISALAGLDNNIYLQTGVIMLIGLLSKTAILITEYAVERHKGGLEPTKAAVEAAGARLRPIIMTVGTMVIGLMPLITSVGGVGGNGNFSLGLGTIVGDIIGSVGLLYITPTLYITLQKIHDKMKSQDYEEE